MNRLLLSFLIGVILALIAFPVFTNRCPSPDQVISAWDQLARDYESGKITFEESIRQADKLIECSEKRRYEQGSLRPSRDGD